jgi:glutaconate CoA-transferase subunit B
MIVDKKYQDYLDATGLKADEFSYIETLAYTVSHEMPDGCFAFVGTGLPLLAAGLAMRNHGPNITVILEAGTIGPQIVDIPVSIADPRAAYRASNLGTMVDAFGTTAARGFCTLGVLGAAECDMYANLNSTCMGGYKPARISGTGKGPKSRFSGSGGASDIASLADKCIVMMVHEKRRFTERVQYLTTVAGMRGPKGETRYDYGLYRGGDVVVISDLCKMKPDPKTGILMATEIFPGVDPQTIKDNTGWDIDVSNAKLIEMPTPEEIRILRMEVDPTRLYLGRKKK